MNPQLERRHWNPKRREVRRRRGATTVEFAIIAIPLLLIIFASVEFGRAMMVMQSLEEASRAACRVAVLRGSDEEEAKAAAAGVLGVADLDAYTVTIAPENFQSVDRWTPVSVTVQTSLDEASWLPMPNYLAGATLTGSCTLPKEYGLED